MIVPRAFILQPIQGIRGFDVVLALGLCESALDSASRNGQGLAIWRRSHQSQLRREASVSPSA
jgi:hypothetical protein